MTSPTALQPAATALWSLGWRKNQARLSSIALMIAEYERAQILERSRRGKRHRARQGQVSVLSGAPYGYRYMRKNDETADYYEVIEAEADVVRLVYDRCTMAHLSIAAIPGCATSRHANAQGKTDALRKTTP